MKLLLQIVFLGIFFSLGSCQSEYDKQLNKAKTLAKEALRIEQSLNINDKLNLRTVDALNKLQDEIAFCAHLSGNKSLFLSEIDQYKANADVKSIENTILITKYP